MNNSSIKEESCGKRLYPSPSPAADLILSFCGGPTTFTYDESININHLQLDYCFVTIAKRLLPFCNNPVHIATMVNFALFSSGIKSPEIIQLAKIIYMSVYKKLHNKKIETSVHEKLNNLKRNLEIYIDDTSYDDSSFDISSWWSSFDINKSVIDFSKITLDFIKNNDFEFDYKNTKFYITLKNKLSDQDIEFIYFILITKRIFSLELFTIHNAVDGFLKTLSIISNINIQDITNKFLKHNILCDILHVNPGINNLLRYIVNDSYTVFSLLNYINNYITNTKLKTETNITFNDVIKYTDIDTYDLKSFDISNLNLQILKSLIQKSHCNILIYGAAGTGKTSFVKSFLKNRKKNFIDYYLKEPSLLTNDIEDDDTKIDFQIIHMMEKAAANKSILVIDECDRFINKSYISSKEYELTKQDVNYILDRKISNNIWIANYIDNMDPSILRRFDYILHFNNYNEQYIIKKLKKCLKNNNIKYKITNKDLEKYLVFKNLTISYIDRFINLAKSISQPNNKQNFLHNLFEICKEQYKNIFDEDINEQLKQKQISKSTMSPVKQYALETLNIDQNPQDIIDSIKNYNGTKSQMPMSLLFTGNPGTGKTEFAKEISRQVGKQLLIRRYSDLCSAFVGSTEKNIASVFAQAQNEDKILLIDECDSFLSDRKNAMHSWEVTQVNEMLTQLERYRGIVIMTTNFKQNIDSASMRRFCWKVVFDELTDDNKITVFKKYFNKNKITDNDISRLNKLKLSFGDIKTVYEKMSLSNKAKTTNEIINNLETEISYKKYGKSIGF